MGGVQQGERGVIVKSNEYVLRKITLKKGTAKEWKFVRSMIQLCA